MKKFNKMYMCPCPGGECVIIIAKNYKHFTKILNKSNIVDDVDDFDCIGKLVDVANLWNVKLKQLIAKSGTCKFYCYGSKTVYNLLK